MKFTNYIFFMGICLLLPLHSMQKSQLFNMHGNIILVINAFIKDQNKMLLEKNKDEEALKRIMLNITIKMKEVMLQSTGYASFQAKELKKIEKRLSSERATGVIESALEAYTKLFVFFKKVASYLDETLKKELLSFHTKSIKKLKADKHDSCVSAYNKIKDFSVNLVSKTQKILAISDSDSDDDELRKAFEEIELDSE